MRALLLLCLLALPFAATAQDRDGNDTPGDWIIDHHKPFGLWDSFCDHRSTDGVKEERCYLRYVEVFSPRPNFGALFVFVTPGPEVEIGLERGTRFKRDGIRVEASDATTWSTDDQSCMLGFTCSFKGPEATEMLTAMRAATTFAFDFTDRHDAEQALRWDLTQFDAAWRDFETEAAKRTLN